MNTETANDSWGEKLPDDFQDMVFNIDIANVLDFIPQPAYQARTDKVRHEWVDDSIKQD